MHAANSSKEILVVDDQPAVALAIQSVLEYFGHRVTCVLDIDVAFKRIATHRYDVIVVDLFMPEFRRTHLITEARRIGLKARIVAVAGKRTHMRSRTDSVTAKRLGADAVVERPFTSEELMRAVCPNENLSHPEAAG